jgi:hypothetical protein
MLCDTGIVLAPGYTQRVIATATQTCTAGVPVCPPSSGDKRVFSVFGGGETDNHGNMYGVSYEPPISELFQMTPEGRFSTIATLTGGGQCIVKSPTEGVRSDRQIVLGGYNEKVKAVFDWSSRR